MDNNPKEEDRRWETEKQEHWAVSESEDILLRRRGIRGAVF